MRNTMLSLAFIFASLTVTASQAAPKKSKALLPFPTTEAMTEAISAYPSDENFNGMLAKWKNLKRAPANSEFSESNIASSPSFKMIRDRFLEIKTADELEAELAKLETDIDKMDAHAKYFAAQMLVFKEMRGLMWRLRPIVDAGAKGNRVTHSMIVSMLRSTRAGIDAYLPTEQWKAGFDFATQPSKKMSAGDQFQTVRDFQNWLATTVGPRLAKSIAIVAHAINSANADTVFVWDNKMSYGKGAFDDGLKRFEGHGQAEMRSTYAFMLFSLHNLYVGCAYNLDDIANVEASIGKLYGIDGFFPGRDLGVTSEDRVGTVMKYRPSGFYSLDAKNGRRYMERAFGYLKNAVKAADHSYQLTQGKVANDNFSLNPILYQRDVSPTLGTGLEKFKAMVEGSTTLRSRITGTTVQVNLPAFYLQPPESLMDLLPTGFENSMPPTAKIKNEKGETLEYRNYQRGSPIQWRNEVWQKYVPSAAGQKPGYMLEANQILRTSIGSNYFWTPMSYYFN